MNEGSGSGKRKEGKTAAGKPCGSGLRPTKIDREGPLRLPLRGMRGS